jgi:hypothetical protein
MKFCVGDQGPPMQFKGTLRPPRELRPPIGKASAKMGTYL